MSTIKSSFFCAFLLLTLVARDTRRYWKILIIHQMLPEFQQSVYISHLPDERRVEQGRVRTVVCVQGPPSGQWWRGYGCRLYVPTQLNVKHFMETVYPINSRRVWMTEPFSVTDELELFRKSVCQINSRNSHIGICEFVSVCFITKFIQSQVN